MPIIGYFVFIASLLITLLFAADRASRSHQQRGHRQDRHPHHRAWLSDGRDRTDYRTTNMDKRSQSTKELKTQGREVVTLASLPCGQLDGGLMGILSAIGASSFEVRFRTAGHPSFTMGMIVAGRRLRPEQVGSIQTLE
jgi:hypothetical protein